MGVLARACVCVRFFLCVCVFLLSFLSVCCFFLFVSLYVGLHLLLTVFFYVRYNIIVPDYFSVNNNPEQYPQHELFLY